MKNSVKVGVVVPVLSQFQLCLQALESIRTKYTWQPYIIDNWRENRGVGKAWNLGIALAFGDQCSHVLVMNDDVVIAPHSIDKVIESWPPEYTLVGFTHYNDISNDPTDKEFDESPDFGAFMVTQETVDSIGWFDENIFAWFEDNDYHYRVNLAGKKAGRYHDAAYHHFKSITTNYFDPDERDRIFRSSHEYYLHKWGGEPGHETFITPYNDKTKTIKDWQHGQPV